MKTKQEIIRALYAQLDAIESIMDIVRTAKSIPSGHLYAHLMGSVSLDQYQAFLSAAKQTGFISESNHLLTWTGPADWTPRNWLNRYDAAQSQLLGTTASDAQVSMPA